MNVSALRVLQVEGLQEDDFWPEEAEDLESGDLTTVICNRSDVHDSADEDEVVLLVLGLHGFKHWHFHQYDGDFSPLFLTGIGTAKRGASSILTLVGC